MIEKFSFDLFGPEKIKKSLKLVLVKGETELREHVVLKLLAYLLYYDPRLKIEVVVGMHYKPDLAIPSEDGRGPEVWIDCGYVSMKKAETLARKLGKTRLVFVKETRSELKKFLHVLERRIDLPKNLEFLAFEPGFVAGVAQALARQNQVTLYPVGEGTIGVVINNEIFESNLYREVLTPGGAG